jgi:hypothetical protein
METDSVEGSEAGGGVEEKENRRPARTNRRVSSVRMGTRVLIGTRPAVVPPAGHPEPPPHLPGLVDVSLRPTVWGEEADQPGDESLSISLLERFDAMETEAGEPERRIATVVMERDQAGRLGVKIGGTPSGVYVDRIDWAVARVASGSLQVIGTRDDGVKEN